MRIRRCVDRFLNNDAPPTIALSRFFALELRAVGSLISILTARTQGTRHPSKAIMDLMTSAHFSQFNHDHHGQILGLRAVLWVLHVTTATPEGQMQRASCHFIFDVLKRPTSNVKKAKTELL
jgi:hypothetical protein